MQVITLAQQKGGVAKSTLAVHLAVEAMRHDLKSIVIEIDKQGTSSFWFGRRLEQAPEVKRVDSVHLSQALAHARGSGVDVVLIDLPGANFPTINPAIKAADFVLIPTRPNEIDIVASGETLGIVQRLSKRYAYVLTFVPSAGSRADETRAEFEAAGYTVAPGGMGDRKAYADAVSSGHAVQEVEPKGKAALEVAALWRYIQKQIGVKHEQVA